MVDDDDDGDLPPMLVTAIDSNTNDINPSTTTDDVKLPKVPITIITGT